MIPYVLSERSLARLKGLHPDLIKVVQRAIQISQIDFMVVEGLRSQTRQRELVNAGKSQTMDSRHLTGHAVDLVAVVNGKDVWTAPEHDQVADAMKTAAAELAIDLEWGGDWTSFIDPPHFQLSRKSYPKQEIINQDAAPVAAAKNVASAAKAAPVSTGGMFAGFLEMMFGWTEPVISFLKGVAAELGQLGSVKAMLLEAGANVQAVGLGLLVLAASIFAKKMTRGSK